MKHEICTELCPRCFRGPLDVYASKSCRTCGGTGVISRATKMETESGSANQETENERLRSKIEALEKENAALRNDPSAMTLVVDTWKKEITHLRSLLVRAVQFQEHNNDCDLHQGEPCDCGLTDLQTEIDQLNK